MTPDTLTREDFADGCLWCDDYDGDHPVAHAYRAHKDEWADIDYEPEYDKTQIHISVAAREAAREAKRDGETWDDFLLRLSEEPPRIERKASLEEVKAAVREVVEP